MLTYEPYNNDSCIYHCEQGELPTKGTEDAIYLDDVEGEYRPLLMPTESRPCFVCSEESFTNTDLITGSITESITGGE